MSGKEEIKKVAEKLMNPTEAKEASEVSTKLLRLADEIERASNAHKKYDYHSPSPFGGGCGTMVPTERSRILLDIARAVRRIATED